ncbi:lysophospholipid acyltransferase family protein [Dokdonella sp.]|uniref:lysophospholipid acyltransferase family protein n=1 Tax=Dokdonella sp. TaxID=2291710 RepID=UPI0031BD6B34|nr:lipid A biosynthesis acyltransferase [Dokdonella sp.]
MHTPYPQWPVALLHGGLRLAGRLPLPLLHALGSALGRLLWLVHARPRAVVERNLSLVLTQERAKTRHALARAALGETGKALLETARIWGGGPDRALALVREVRGGELIDAALASGRGLILAAPHLGCWELLNYWLAARTPLAILYRAPRQAWLEPLLRRARGTLAVEQVRAEGAGVRTLYKRLAGGGVVGILPDQKPRQGEGALAPFFGVPADTMVLLPRLARRTGAVVLFGFAERLPRGAGFRLHFLPAPDGLDDADLTLACGALNRGVEACVERAFIQYQWAYKRWPKDARASTPAASGR